MKALIVHHRWGYGGAMVVFYYTVKALHEAGFDVTVITADEPDLKAYEEIVGESFPESVRVKSIIPFNIKAFTIYKGIISWLEAFKDSYDVIVATSAHGLPIGARRIKKPIVYYMHFPPALMTDTRWNPAFSRYTLKNPLKHGVSESILSLILWVYAKPYAILTKRYYRDLVEVSRRILANSTYTLNAFKHTLEVFGLSYELLRKVEILHPPLPRMRDLIEARCGAREPCVVTIGRFSSEKNYELVVETARVLRDTVFYIVGEVHGGPSRAYYDKIRRSSPRNLILEANVSQARKLSLLSKCSVYLHPMVGEHFGIAPLEALAAGLTPVVHKASGTWTDVCLEDSYCYGFDELNPSEVASRVSEALSKPRVAPLEHLENFSPERFSERLVRVVEEVAGD